MEKLKVKHDHTLTDIIKVGIFALFLILPILVFLPNCLYYGFNEHAVVNTEVKEVYEYKQINFNQIIPNGNFNEDNGWITNGGNISINTSLHELNFTASRQYGNFVSNPSLSLVVNHTYLLSLYHKGTTGSINVYTNGGDYFQLNLTNVNDVDYTLRQGIKKIVNNNSSLIFFQDNRTSDWTLQQFQYIQCFDLTQMFGEGNEPTINEFNQIFNDNYYQYTLSQIENIKIDTGETKNYTDIASNITNAWQETWETPMLQWTNSNVFKFTINAFTNVFGITQESKMANYLTYLLVITCIYLIFDIVLTLTTKLTHLINAK